MPGRLEISYDRPGTNPRAFIGDVARQLPSLLQPAPADPVVGKEETERSVEPTAMRSTRKRNWEWERIVAEMHAAIGAALFEDPRNLEVRLSWSRGQTNCFRVNWWTAECVRGSRIRRSALVRVEREPCGYRVRPDRPLAA
jgi:hypothetical protein